MPILASEASLCENKNSSNKMLPPVGIETRPLINLWFQVKHSPFWTNLSFVCKTETLGSLYSHALLIPTKYPSPEIKWCINRSLKIFQAANDKLVQKGECWTWNQRLIRGPGSILTGSNILLLEFLFSRSKASDDNIAIIANFGSFEKPLFRCF